MKQHYYPLSFSSIKAFSNSTAHFIAYKNRQQESTPAMQFGTAVHCAILEADRFEIEYKKLEVRRGTAAYRKVIEDNPDVKNWLTASEYDEACRIRDAVIKHDKARQLLRACTSYEQLLQGSIMGVPFKGYADAIGEGFCIDIKTTQKGGPRDFVNDAYRQKYHIQGYIYLELAKQNYGTSFSDHWIIAAEKGSPYVITCYKLTAEYLNRGREDLARLLDNWAQWDGKPRGYDADTAFGHFELDLPTWAI